MASATWPASIFHIWGGGKLSAKVSRPAAPGPVWRGCMRVSISSLHIGRYRAAPRRWGIIWRVFANRWLSRILRSMTHCRRLSNFPFRLGIVSPTGPIDASKYMAPKNAQKACRQPSQFDIGPERTSVMRMGISVHALARGGFGVRRIGWWPITAPAAMAAAFVVASALAAIVLAVFGAGERGTVLALRATARWSFLLFWLAYAGGAMAALCGPRLGELARRGRELGLAFASAQFVHVVLVLWLFYVTARPGGMIFSGSAFSAPNSSRCSPCRGCTTCLNRACGGHSARLRLNILPSSSPPILYWLRCKRAGSASIR